MLMMNDLDKVYFAPGSLCMVRHNIEYKPIMYVVEKISRNVKNKDTGVLENLFIGIKCRWFDKNETLQEAVFNTKDLQLIEE